MPAIRASSLCRSRSVSLAAIVIAAAFGSSTGSDWPMYRHDTRRSAETSESLSVPLHLQWVRHSRAPRRAWPAQNGLRFDEARQPVVMGGTVFTGSSVDDRVVALDLRTGAQKWVFYTGGPVRFAPVAAAGNVYVGSDDGFVYCLSAADGTLVWRFQAAPTGRRVIGNSRLVSAWPVRGGPVISGDTLYLAAGFWSFAGVFLYALDAGSGDVIWVNDGSGANWTDQPHSGAVSFGGPSPQGYIAVAGDMLIVPCGRSVPAAYDRHTGEFRYFELAANKSNGGSHAAVYGNTFFCPPYFFDAATGARSTGSARTWYDITTASLLASGEEFRGGTGKVEKVGGAWQATIVGTPSSLVAADGMLLATTREGGLYCFGPSQTTAVEYDSVLVSPAPVGDSWTSAAAGILAQAGSDNGYCVALGLGSGRLAEEIARQSSMHVIALDTSAAVVERERRRLRAAGLYGTRVSVLHGDLNSLQLPPYMATLVVAEDLGAAGLDRGSEFAASVFGVLRPYGATACLPVENGSLFETWAEDNSGVGASVALSGGFTVMTRPGPLPGAGQWTHQYADGANTVVSSDQLVKAPLGLLWFGGTTNTDVLPRHGHGPSPQVAAGRLFIEGPNMLRGIDVYTGRILWQADLPNLGTWYNYTSHEPGANGIGSNYVSQEDAVYVVYQQKCLRLDPATGERVGEFSLPPGAAGSEPRWGYIGVQDSFLVAGSGVLKFDNSTPGTQTFNATSSKELVVMNRYSGRVAWKYEMKYGFRHNAIALSGDKVFCIDRLPAEAIGFMKRRQAEVNEEQEILAFDIRTGAVLWRVTDGVFGTWLGYSAKQDLLIQAGRASRDMLGGEPNGVVMAYRGSNGSLAWSKSTTYEGPCLLHHDRIITQGYALDIVTGERSKRTHPLTEESLDWRFTRKYGCNTAIGSEHLLTFRSGAAGFYDLANDGGTGNFGGFKSGCSSNLIVADGVLCAPDYTRTCNCAYQNQASLGLVHWPEQEMWTYNDYGTGSGGVRRVGINFGAPGDRMTPGGVLWLDYPSVGNVSPDITTTVSFGTSGQSGTFRHHALRVRGGEGLRWVAASGLVNPRAIVLSLRNQSAQTYNVRLHFLEPEGRAAGERVFDVSVQGHAVADLDIVGETGGAMRGLVKTFAGIDASGDLTVTFTAKKGVPVVSGIEVIHEDYPMDSLPPIPVSVAGRDDAELVARTLGSGIVKPLTTRPGFAIRFGGDDAIGSQPPGTGGRSGATAVAGDATRSAAVRGVGELTDGIGAVPGNPRVSIVGEAPGHDASDGEEMHGILCEYWAGIDGDDGADEAPGQEAGSTVGYRSSPPTGVRVLDSLRVTANWADNYGLRLRGYICPAETDEYTFWLAADETAELWLSPNESEDAKKRIALVSEAVEPDAFDVADEQKSRAIRLVKGQRYYTEILHREGDGNDHCSVAWARRGDARQIVSGAHLVLRRQEERLSLD